MMIHGSCHCRNICFTLVWEPDPLEIAARACSCTFCRKHGGVWTADPKASLAIVIENPELVSAYMFGTRTAEFHICVRCGVVPVVTSTIDGRVYAVVSVNAFEGVDPAMLRPVAASFDGETEATRLERRQRHWIAAVTMRRADPQPLPGRAV